MKSFNVIYHSEVFGNESPIEIKYVKPYDDAPDVRSISIGLSANPSPASFNPELTGWINMNLGANIVYTVPVSDEVVDTILNSLSASEIDKRLYLCIKDDTITGRSPITFQIEQSEQTAPTVNRILFSKTGILPATFDGLFVQNKSKAVIQMSASGKYGATIASIETTLDGNTYSGDDITSAIVTGSGTLPVVTTVTDSRGMITTLSDNIDVFEYSAPALIGVNGESTPLCYRSDEIGNPDDALGEFVWLKVKRKFSSIIYGGTEKNTCRLYYRYKADGATSWHGWIEKTSSLTNNEYKGQANEDTASLTTVYIYQVKVEDAIGESYEIEFRIATAEVALHLNRGGTAVGIGRYANDSRPHSLSIGWDTYFDADVFKKSGNNYIPLMTAIADAVYPVGSIYMSTNNVDPSAIFGGTWERIENRFLLSAGSSYTAGSTGGEAQHMLTETEMPEHGHKTLYYSSAAGAYNWGYNYTNATGKGKFSVSDAEDNSGISHTGGNQPHNNMPPYLAVYMWKRTA